MLVGLVPGLLRGERAVSGARDAQLSGRARFASSSQLVNLDFSILNLGFVSFPGWISEHWDFHFQEKYLWHEWWSTERKCLCWLWLWLVNVASGVSSPMTRRSKRTPIQDDLLGGRVKKMEVRIFQNCQNRWAVGMDEKPCKMSTTEMDTWRQLTKKSDGWSVAAT